MSEEAFAGMNPGISEADVADYLAQHPDFFSRHAGLLAQLHVPHDSGGAISLVERQTSLLRASNNKLNEHLSDLIEAARYNDLQFEKTKRMVLSLLDCMTLDEIGIAIKESLCDDFHGDITRLLLFSKTEFNTNNLRIVDPRQMGPVTPLVGSNLPSCGQLTREQNRFIFDDMAVRVQSAAVVPLVKGETLGLLAIGSFKVGYFHSGQGTLFLNYVGEVLSRVLSRIMHQLDEPRAD